MVRLLSKLSCAEPLQPSPLSLWYALLAKCAMCLDTCNNHIVPSIMVRALHYSTLRGSMPRLATSPGRLAKSTSFSSHQANFHHLTSSLHLRPRVDMTTFIPVVTLRNDPRAWQPSGPHNLGTPMPRCLSGLFSVRLKACSRCCRPLFQDLKQAAYSTRAELRTSFISNSTRLNGASVVLRLA